MARRSNHDASAADELPERFAHYRILKRLGQGGMGTVFLAQDTRLERRVALKVCHITDSREALERFRREAQAAASLRHPNLCPVHDFDVWDGTPYLTMAVIEGPTLDLWVEGRGGLTQGEAAIIVRKLALALQTAHDRGVTHRDLKPSNIAIEKNEPIVLDFGLARQDARPEKKLTRQGMIMGTPAYMAPEQIGSGAPIGPSCDIYSLGVILYELLAGDVPFHDELVALMGRILHEPPPPPSGRRKNLDPRLEEICLRALAKKPAHRWDSMSDFASALTEWLTGAASDDTSRAPVLRRVAAHSSAAGNGNTHQDRPAAVWQPGQVQPVPGYRRSGGPGQTEGATIPEPQSVARRERSASSESGVSVVAIVLCIGGGVLALFLLCVVIMVTTAFPPPPQEGGLTVLPPQKAPVNVLLPNAQPPVVPPPGTEQVDTADAALVALRSKNMILQARALQWLNAGQVDETKRAAIAQELETLARGDGHLRGPALDALNTWAGPENVAALIALLDEERTAGVSNHDRAKAMKVLGRLKDPRAADVIARNLSNFFLREQSRDVLEKMGPAAEKAVAAQLANPDENARNAARNLLVSFGTQESVILPILLSELTAANMARKRAAAAWFATARLVPGQQDKVADALESLLKDSDTGSRLAGVKALTVWATKANGPALVQLIEKGGRGFDAGELRQQAAAILGKLKDTRAAAAIARSLGSNNPTERIWARSSLLQLGAGPGVEEAVLPYLANQFGHGVPEACTVLGAVGTRTSIPPLQGVVLQGRSNVFYRNALIPAQQAILQINARLGVDKMKPQAAPRFE